VSPANFAGNSFTLLASNHSERNTEGENTPEIKEDISMKKSLRILLIASLAAFCLLALVSCGGDSDQSNAQSEIQQQEKDMRAAPEPTAPEKPAAPATNP